MLPSSWSFTTQRQAAGQWTFDEGDGRSAADSSGNDHDASLNETAGWITGKSGSALSNVPSQARVAASEAAVKRGKAVEVADETTATSITYAQPDGKTFKTEVTTGPVRTRQGSGWVPVDTTLAEQGGKLRPKALAEGAVVELSAGGTDPFVKMTADGTSYALRWPTPLPKPTIKGSVATYTDAAGAGADLVVTALPTGFRHEVVLRQRPSKPLELRIGVEDEGLTLSEGKGGRLLLKGKDKKLVVAGTRPMVSDGSARDLPAKRGKAGADVVTKNGRTELVLKPDQAFLADTDTAYPVRVASAVTLPLASDMEVTTFDTADSPAHGHRLPHGRHHKRVHQVAGAPAVRHHGPAGKHGDRRHAVDEHHRQPQLRPRARQRHPGRPPDQRMEPGQHLLGQQARLHHRGRLHQLQGRQLGLRRLPGQYGLERHRHRPGLGRRRRQPRSGAQVAR